MSSISLVYSNRKVCAKYDGQNRRFRSFTTIDPTTRKACKGKRKVWKSSNFLEFLDYGKLLKILRTSQARTEDQEAVGG